MSSPVMLAHRVRVKNLYRHALKCTHNWAIDRTVLSKVRPRPRPYSRRASLLVLVHYRGDGLSCPVGVSGVWRRERAWAAHDGCIPGAQAAIILRARFDANKNEKNLAVSEKLVEDGEAELARNRHPDPYTQPTEKGGTKWQRNTPVPTSLLENPYVSH